MLYYAALAPAAGVEVALPLEKKETRTAKIETETGTVEIKESGTVEER